MFRLNFEVLHFNKRHCSYYLDGPKGHKAITAIAVRPGVPARILSLFQDKHLPTKVSLLKGNEAKQE